MLGDRELQRPIELVEPHDEEGSWLLTLAVAGDD